MPEFILNIWGEPFVYFIDVFYVLWERMLELKALKLYLASYKDMRFNSFEEVLEKLKSDLSTLAEPKYLKIDIYDRHYIMISWSNTGNETYSENFAFDSYLKSSSELVALNDSKDPLSTVLSYSDAIVNINHSVPVICDIYFITDEDKEKIKGEFLKAIIALKDEKIITEEVPKFILNRMKKFATNFEVIVDFNIRWNIKKIRSVYQGDLSKLIGRDAYIQQITSEFSSYTN